MAAGSWSLTEELFARGNAGFVDELRRVHLADRLGDFAPRWFADARPFARQALLDYLSRPLNAYRHEPLVKRLFKLAEAGGDDELMGAFLVALDRTVRRVRRTITRRKHQTFDSRAAAEAAVRAWAAEGYEDRDRSTSGIGTCTPTPGSGSRSWRPRATRPCPGRRTTTLARPGPADRGRCACGPGHRRWTWTSPGSKGGSPSSRCRPAGTCGGGPGGTSARSARPTRPGT